jgi:hypothetical protein
MFFVFLLIEEEKFFFCDLKGKRSACTCKQKCEKKKKEKVAIKNKNRMENTRVRGKTVHKKRKV